MEYKWCIRCGEEKETTEFYKNNYNRDGLTTYCKCCIRELVKANRPKDHNEKCKEYYKKNKDRLIEKAKENYEDKKEYYSNYHKEYYEKNKESIREYQRLYREKKKKERLLNNLEL